MITDVTVPHDQLFKKIKFKKAYILVLFLSSVGSEFQSLAPAIIWKVFLPEEVLDCGMLRVSRKPANLFKSAVFGETLSINCDM